MMEFSYLLNHLLYKVVLPFIFITKQNFQGEGGGGVIILKYIISRALSGLKLLFLTKMAILG